MNDNHKFQDHRMSAAQATGCREAAYRGWDFSAAVDKAPLWIRALEMTFRPSSLIILAVIGAVISLFWIG